VELGRYGRNRTNVWDYAGVNAFGAARDEELAMHPTVKPVALVEDAIKDCSNRGGIVLDAFVGSGTTLIAAERVGRRGFGIELDPRYVDVTLERFRKTFDVDAVHVKSGLQFSELK
jgi:DNA modification methylase